MKIALALVALLLAACEPLVLNPDVYSLEPAATAQLRAKTITVGNAYPAETRLKMADGHEVDLAHFTDTAAVMLSRALRSGGIAVEADAKKSVVLRVHSPTATHNFYVVVGEITLNAQLGDGTHLSYVAANTTPQGYERAFEGAILFALNRLTADARFIEYVNR